MTSSQRWKTLACFILIHAAALSGNAAEVRLKPRVESRGSVVLLGDIATLTDSQPKANSGESSAAPKQGFAQLARIELFPAPSVSRSRTIRRREIRELLGLHGIDLNTIRFAGAESVIVQTSRRPRLRIGERDVEPPSKVSAAAFTTAKPIAQATTKIKQPETELVLATVRNLRRGEIIRASHVALIPVPISGRGSVSSLGIQPAAEREDVIGMATNRPFAANQPLDVRALQRPIVVKRGELVTVTSLAPGVSVETVARATENAAMDDLVVLESVVNRKRYAAYVTGHNTARVYASGIRVSSPAVRPGKKPNPTTLDSGATIR